MHTTDYHHRPLRRPAPFGERGEGVISTAIAVLIIAFLGVAMWVGFNAIFADATKTTTEQVHLIGR
ncbi:MAG: hypothetical protein U0Q22_03875 [Acidimicrobiales bacterium]